MILKIISCIFLILATIFLLDLNPETVTSDLLKLTKKKESLRSLSLSQKTGKKKKNLIEHLVYIRTSLEAMGRGDKFAVVICLSLILMALGATLAVLLNNYFLIPSFAAFMAIIPFVYVRSSLDTYQRHVRDELDTALSIITTSYERNENLINAVKENLAAIRPPLNEHFKAFITDATVINSSTIVAIRNLKTKVDNEIFHEWCDALIQCEADSTLRDTLQPTVSRLADERMVNNELSNMMSAVRMEYYTMAGMVVGNIPLLYILNKDWYHTLVYETSGKITLGICGIVIFVTYLFLLKFTKPIEYKG